MAKKVVETWISDVIGVCEFSSENDMREFDKKLNDKEWIVECCQDCIDEYTEEVEIDDIKPLGDGRFEIVLLAKNLVEYIKNKLSWNVIYGTCFNELVDLIDNYEEESDEIDELIQKHLEKKIDEFADEINALVKFTVAQ